MGRDFLWAKAWKELWDAQQAAQAQQPQVELSQAVCPLEQQIAQLVEQWVAPQVQRGEWALQQAQRVPQALVRLARPQAPLQRQEQAP